MPFGADAVARDDALPLEQELGERAPLRLPAKRRSVRDQRPAVAVAPWRAPAGEAARAALVLRRAEPARGTQRRPRVVRHLARPDEIPQRGQGDGLVEPGLVEQLDPEERAASSAARIRVVLVGLRARRGRHLAERGCVLAEVQRDPVGPGADPHDLAARGQRVEVLRPVARDAPRQDLGFPQCDRQRERLQRHERFAQRRPPVDAVPGRQEPRERLLLDGLDLAPKRGERRAAQATQYIGVAPLALGPAGTQLAAHEQLGALELPTASPRRRGRSARSPARW